MSPRSRSRWREGQEETFGHGSVKFKEEDTAEDQEQRRTVVVV